MTTDARRIKELAKKDPPDLDALEEILDKAHHQNRLAAVRTLSKRDQRRLYEAAEGRPASLEQFVPANADPLEEIIHQGQNTLPAFRSFEKRFCRPPADHSEQSSARDGKGESAGLYEGESMPPASDGRQARAYSDTSESDSLWGYNEQTFRSLTGPGYFTAYESEDSGETWLDYRQIPDGRLQDWPDLASNDARLGRFVYSGLVDHMRSLSDHVTVGRAYDEDEPLDNWFVLVRQPR